MNKQQRFGALQQTLAQAQGLGAGTGRRHQEAHPRQPGDLAGHRRLRRPGNFLRVRLHLLGSLVDCLGLRGIRCLIQSVLR